MCLKGGSYTEHRLHGMKAGAAWAALEFAKVSSEVHSPFFMSDALNKSNALRLHWPL